MNLKRLFIYFLIIFLLALLAVYKTDITGNAVTEYEREEAFVERVIDGDTLVYRIGNITQSCRLLGIYNKIV